MGEIPIIGECKLKPGSVQLLVCSTLELERIKSKVIQSFPKARKQMDDVIGMLIQIARQESISPSMWKEAVKTAQDIREVLNEQEQAANEVAIKAAAKGKPEIVQ
jgi:hypothetical protein